MAASSFPVATRPLFIEHRKWRVQCANEDLPPSSRDEAIRDARFAMWGAIGMKSSPQLRNSRNVSKNRRRRGDKPKKQARLVIEMPLLDESQQALASLLIDLLDVEAQECKASLVLGSSDIRELISDKIGVSHQITTLDEGEFPQIDPHCDLVMVLAPNSFQISAIEKVAAAIGEKPIVVVNPQWGEEDDVSFCKSFEVAYSFTPLSIQGIFLSKMEGAILRRMSSSPWRIFTKRDDGSYRCVSSGGNRPSQKDLEDALYESVASSSPIVKSLNFLKNFKIKNFKF